MYAQNPNEDHRDRLQLSWIEVRDERGRTHMESRWTVVRRPLAGDAAHAA